MCEKSKIQIEEVLNEALQDGVLIIGEPEEPKGLEISAEDYPDLLEVEGESQ